MNKENTEKLINDFPGLFRIKDRRKSNVAAFGFECGDGWEPLIRRLCEKLEPIGVRAVQVKEKFGGLRFYIDRHTDIADAAIAVAEAEAWEVCEWCGAAGVTRHDRSWVKTLCAPCHIIPEREEAARKGETVPKSQDQIAQEAYDKLIMALDDGQTPTALRHAKEHAADALRATLRNWREVALKLRASRDETWRRYQVDRADAKHRRGKVKEMKEEQERAFIESMRWLWLDHIESGYGDEDHTPATMKVSPCGSRMKIDAACKTFAIAARPEGCMVEFDECEDCRARYERITGSVYAPDPEHETQQERDKPDGSKPDGQGAA